MLTAEAKSQTIARLVSNWAELYGHRHFNLALFEIDSALHHSPENSLLWFMKGTTQLAQRDVRSAKKSFASARTHQGTAIEEREFEQWSPNLAPALARVDQLLANSLFPDAPAKPFLWLENPGIVSTAASKGSAFAFSPTPVSATVAPASVVAPPIVATTTTAPQPSEPAAATWQLWESQLQRLLVEGEFDKAIAQVQAAIDKHPENHWLAEWRGRIHEKQGDRIAAAKHLITAMRLAQERGAVDKARTIARDINGLAHDNNDVLMEAGKTMASVGLLPQAGDAFRYAESLARRTNDHPRLIQALRQLTKIFPENSTYSRELYKIIGQNNPPVISGSTAPALPSQQAAKKSMIRPRISITNPDSDVEKPWRSSQTFLSAVCMSIGFIAGIGGSSKGAFIFLIIHTIFSNIIAKAFNKTQVLPIRRAATVLLIIGFILGLRR